jgi:hypothetical protein
VVLPLIVAVPWGVIPGFVPYLPLPAQEKERGARGAIL